MSTAVDWRAANARRMHRHGLVEPLDSVPAAAAAMAGVHAQVMSAAEISVGTRVADVTRADVADALWEARSLVRTFGPRGTVHLLATGDLPWWSAALGSVPRAGGHAPGVRLDDAETDDIVAAVDAALREADHTVEELDDRVFRACGGWAVEPSMPAFGGYWPRWRQALGVAAVRMVLCFGPPRGRRVTYASPRRWVPELEVVDPAEAALGLLTAYLRTYGPATPAHLAQWLATTPRWTTDLFDRADLDEVLLDGDPAWVLRGDTVFESPDPPAVRLLPYFDAFAVGSQPRDLLFSGRAAERALAGRQAGNFPVLLLDGVVGGVWHHRRSGRRVAVTVEPLAPLSARRGRALCPEVERLGAILEATTVELTIGAVTVGPHA